MSFSTFSITAQARECSYWNTNVRITGHGRSEVRRFMRHLERREKSCINEGDGNQCIAVTYAITNGPIYLGKRLVCMDNWALDGVVNLENFEDVISE